MPDKYSPEAIQDGRHIRFVALVGGAAAGTRRSSPAYLGRDADG